MWECVDVVDWGLICACVVHVCVPVWCMCVHFVCRCVFDRYICMTTCKCSCCVCTYVCVHGYAFMYVHEHGNVGNMHVCGYIHVSSHVNVWSRVHESHIAQNRWVSLGCSTVLN